MTLLMNGLCECTHSSTLSHFCIFHVIFNIIVLAGFHVIDENTWAWGHTDVALHSLGL